MADYPAMPLWTDAYLADTRHLSTLEHGAYMLLLMEAWRRPSCALPDDDKLLAKLAGLTVEEWQEIKSAVMAFWSYDGRSREWSQKRQKKERYYVADVSGKRRDAALTRWNKTKSDDASAMQKPCKTDAPTPTPKEPPIIPLPGDGEKLDLKDGNPKPEDLYNIAAKSRGWPQARLPLSDQRKRKLAKRVKDLGGVEKWKELLRIAGKSPHLCGQNSRGWRVDLAWLLSPENCDKVLDGRYLPMAGGGRERGGASIVDQVLSEAGIER